ncbi:unnamed protein product [Brassica oleracea var. botrytis]
MPPTNPFDDFIISSYFDNERSNDQRRGSPSWSEQLPAESGLYLNLDVESSDSLRARNLQLGEDLERIHEMERNLQNERDPDRRREGASRIDREVRELERKISLCQTRDAVRDDQLDVWREGLYEELATQGEKQARLTCTTTLTAQAWAGPTSILRGAVGRPAYYGHPPVGISA